MQCTDERTMCNTQVTVLVLVLVLVPVPVPLLVPVLVLVVYVGLPAIRYSSDSLIIAHRQTDRPTVLQWDSVNWTGMSFISVQCLLLTGATKHLSSLTPPFTHTHRDRQTSVQHAQLLSIISISRLYNYISNQQHTSIYIIIIIIIISSRSFISSVVLAILQRCPDTATSPVSACTSSTHGWTCGLDFQSVDRSVWQTIWAHSLDILDLYTPSVQPCDVNHRPPTKYDALSHGYYRQPSCRDTAIPSVCPVCLSVRLLVSRISNSYRWISTKCCGMIELWPRSNQLHLLLICRINWSTFLR